MTHPVAIENTQPLVDSMNKPHGWCTGAEQAELARLAEGRYVLEIGGWQGLSTIALARAADFVVTLDHWQGDADTERVAGPHTREQLLPRWLANIHTAGLAAKVAPFCGVLGDVLTLLDPRHFGLIFYDADHDADSTRFALDWAWPGMVERAAMGLPTTIAVHDFKPQNQRYAETNATILEWASRHRLEMQRVDSLAIFSGCPVETPQSD